MTFHRLGTFGSYRSRFIQDFFRRVGRVVGRGFDDVSRLVAELARCVFTLLQLAAKVVFPLFCRCFRVPRIFVT